MVAELIDEDEEAVLAKEAAPAEEAEHEEEERPIAALSRRTPAPRADTSPGGSAVVQPRVAAGQRLRLTLNAAGKGGERATPAS